MVPLALVSVVAVGMSLLLTSCMACRIWERGYIVHGTLIDGDNGNPLVGVPFVIYLEAPSDDTGSVDTFPSVGSTEAGGAFEVQASTAVGSECVNVFLELWADTPVVSYPEVAQAVLQFELDGSEREVRVEITEDMIFWEERPDDLEPHIDLGEIIISSDD